MSRAQRGSNVEIESKNRRNIFSYHLPPNKDINERRHNSLEPRVIGDGEDIKQVVEIVNDPNSKSALEQIKRMNMRRTLQNYINKKGKREFDNTQKNRSLKKDDMENNENKENKENKNDLNLEDSKPGMIKRVGPNYATRNTRGNFGDKMNKTNENIKINEKYTRVKNNENVEATSNNTIRNRRNNHSVKVITDIKTNNNQINDNNNIKSMNNNNNNRYTNNINVKDYPVKVNTYEDESPFQNKSVDKFNKDNKDIKENKNIKDNQDMKDNKDLQ